MRKGQFMNDQMAGNIIFGPVPSRRLGRSLGINNIPPMHCSYSCIYCQLGRNKKLITERRKFYDPEVVFKKAEIKINEVLKQKGTIDYITFVPDGEPSLDSNLGVTIGLLKKTGIKIAVISNASLMADEKVRNELLGADRVSLKTDTVREKVWRKINRPHRALSLAGIERGVKSFADNFEGELNTETMIVDNINSGESDIALTADFIKSLSPAKAYISIPTRPPAESYVIPPQETLVVDAYRIFTDAGLYVECITGHEGNEFSSSGDITEDILSITSVHPMRDDSIKLLLLRAGADWGIVDNLLSVGELVEKSYNDRKFYIRKFH